ncbi:MAG: ATP-binding cassette domain-containing protein [Sporolactobacillus sp.]
MILLEIEHLICEVEGRQLFEAEHLTVSEGARIGLVGRNGAGKTTLLRLLAGQRAVEAGTVDCRVSRFLLPQFRSAVGEKSGGEVTQQYVQQAISSDAGLLLVDEPTTSLDMAHIEWLEQALSSRKGAMIVVSHDRAFLDALCTTIWAIEDGSVQVYPGNYTAYMQPVD